MNKEQVHAKGKLRITLVNDKGIVIQEKKVENLITTAGLAHMAQRVNGSGDVMSHMAIGSNNTAAVIGDTALASELDRVTFDSASVTDNVISYTATFGPGVGTGTVREAGILNDSSGGTLLNRTTFSDVGKSAGDTMTINWSVTIS